MRPWADAGFGRLTKEVDKIDTFRDNWWCVPGKEEDGSWQFRGRMELPPALAQLGAPEAPFLSDAERAEAAGDWEKLKSLPAAPSWLAAQTLEWAEREPADPRLPEALHLAVRATRYGCTDGDNRKYSKAAFDLLHRRFPSSEWTKKTPYYY